MFVERYTSRELADKQISHSQSQQADYHSKTITWEGEKVTVRFWQQTEQERPFTTRLFREADGVIYMFDHGKDLRKIEAACDRFDKLVS